MLLGHSMRREEFVEAAKRYRSTASACLRPLAAPQRKGGVTTSAVPAMVAASRSPPSSAAPHARNRATHLQRASGCRSLRCRVRPGGVTTSAVAATAAASRALPSSAARHARYLIATHPRRACGCPSEPVRECQRIFPPHCPASDSSLFLRVVCEVSLVWVAPTTQWDEHTLGRALYRVPSLEDGRVRTGKLSMSRATVPT